MDVLADAGIYSKLQKCLAPDHLMHRLAGALGVRSGDRVLDIGCGPADILEYLPDGIDYTGFDVSDRYIAAARRRYGERGKFAVRPVSRSVEANGSYDIVISIGVLHHLSDEDARTLFDCASNALRPGGRLVTCDPVRLQGQHPVARLLIALDRGAFVRPFEGYLALARRRFPHAAAKIVHDLLTVPYTHCFIEASKE